jgi:hypothetical protein
MQAEEMRLDGNAAAGALRDVFARDITDAMATCAGCGQQARMAELLEYGHAMGIVLRCPGCEHVMMRLVYSPGWLRLDGSGIAVLTIPQTVS